MTFTSPCPRSWCMQSDCPWAGRAWAVYFNALFKSRDDPLIQFYSAIKDPWINPIMSRPMAEPGVLHVIIVGGGCTVTKLLLMRFHKAPNQAVPACILANSLKNNSFPKTIANWGARTTTTTLHFQPSQQQSLIPAREGPNAHTVINLNVLSVPRLTDADLAEAEEYKSFCVKLIKSEANASSARSFMNRKINIQLLLYTEREFNFCPSLLRASAEKRRNERI